MEKKIILIIGLISLLVLGSCASNKQVANKPSKPKCDAYR